MVVGLTAPFTGEARLADAWFAGDQHGAGASGESRLPCGPKSIEFAGTPDERPWANQHGGQTGALHGRIGCRSAGIVGGLQAEFEHMLRAREVFELAHPQVGEQNVVAQ